MDTPIANPLEKRRLHVRTAAVAVDTESHIAARIAAAHRIPWGRGHDGANVRAWRDAWTPARTIAVRNSEPQQQRRDMFKGA